MTRLLLAVTAPLCLPADSETCTSSSSSTAMRARTATTTTALPRRRSPRQRQSPHPRYIRRSAVHLLACVTRTRPGMYHLTLAASSPTQENTCPRDMFSLRPGSGYNKGSAHSRKATQGHGGHSRRHCGQDPHRATANSPRCGQQGTARARLRSSRRACPGPGPGPGQCGSSREAAACSR